MMRWRGNKNTCGTGRLVFTKCFSCWPDGEEEREVNEVEAAHLHTETKKTIHTSPPAENTLTLQSCYNIHRVSVAVKQQGRKQDSSDGLPNIIPNYQPLNDCRFSQGTADTHIPSV